MSVEKKQKSILWYILMTIVVFCYSYQFDLGILGFPAWFHSVRFGAFVIYVWFAVVSLGRNSRVDVGSSTGGRFYKKLFTSHVFLFLYMLFLYFSIGLEEGDHMVVILLNFFFVRLIPIYLCIRLFSNLDEFMTVVLASTYLQTVIIWICMVFTPIGNLIDIVFNASEDYIGHRDGYAGGLGCITSLGYIRYSLGQLACFYFFEKKNKLVYGLLFLPLFLTGTMIARTGLFMGSIIILFMAYHLVSIKSIKSIASVSLVSVFILVLSLQILSNKEVSSFFEERYYRMNSLVESSKDEGFFNNGFFYAYLHGEGSFLPDLSFETIIGTGVPSGVAGNGVKVNIDGGYLRLYVAYGLIISVLFYFLLYINMFRVSRKTLGKIMKDTLLLTLLLLIVAEYKEWSFYSTPYIWFFCVVAILAPKENEMLGLNTVKIN